MSVQQDVNLIVVGSVGIDTIETPAARREEILGGSASFACVAASYFTRVGMVGVVGTDFPAAYREQYLRAGVNLDGLQVKDGETFRWSGVYEENMDNRRTLSTELNVFESFSPEIPVSYQQAPYLFLANIGPDLQLHVLDQVKRPRFILADTMDLWINLQRDNLLAVIKRVHMLTLNESEARHLTGEHNLIRAARKILNWGPRYVLIKKGENGSILFSGESIFLMPAFPLEEVVDPTGAGDTFAGGFMGSLAAQSRVTGASIRRSMLYGSVVASFGVEDFSLDKLSALTVEQIEERAALFRTMLKVG